MHHHKQLPPQQRTATPQLHWPPEDKLYVNDHGTAVLEQCTNNWHSCHMQICQLKADANCRTIQQIGSEEFCKTNTTVQLSRQKAPALTRCTITSSFLRSKGLPEVHWPPEDKLYVNDHGTAVLKAQKRLAGPTSHSKEKGTVSIPQSAQHKPISTSQDAVDDVLRMNGMNVR
ncbi:hypothetical protein Anapl_10125 [Anas platyrhynchos]|uniref:Uncharacterized protein n=1 Tax=Anas platyrhynchos TaxID=8839 RepID=R0JZ19_ANAPL|nr:hypothetical protein Anapl_10125 [Anas platyrhynchos]